MKKLVFLILVLVPKLFGQNLSPLLTPMTSNVMNSTPEIVRKLQMNFDKQIPGTKPGFAADIINKKLIDFKDYYFNKIKNPDVEYNKVDKVIKINIPFNGITPISINLKDDLLKKSSLENILSNVIEENLVNKFFYFPLDKVITDLKIKKELKDNIFAGIYNFITESDVVKGIPEIKNLSDVKSDYLSGVSKVAAKILVNNIIENIKKDDYFKDIDFTKPLSEYKDEYLTKITHILNTTFETNTNKLKAILLNTFDDVQTEINKITDNLNRLLVSGNIGVSLSEGTGDFGTGFQLLWNINSNIQGGVYLNGSLAQSDTTLPKNSLAAIQLRFLIWEKVQIEALGSMYFGSGNFKSLRYFELGGGASVNLSNSIIFGTGYFQEGNSKITGTSQTAEIPTIRTFAIFLRSVIPTLPTIYLGSTWEGDSKPNFGFKITYPLNNKF